MPRSRPPRHVVRNRRRVLPLVLVGILLAGLVGSWLVLARPDPGAARPDPGAGGSDASAARGPVPSLTRLSPRPDPTRLPGRLAAGSPGPVERWTGVLDRLLRRRADAYASGSRAALGTVYTPGSAVLRRDRAVLAAYGRRGLTVAGAHVRVRHAHPVARGRRTILLRVVDRLGPATAVDDASGVRRALPRDRPTRHRMLLIRGRDGWRIASVVARTG